MNDKNGFTLIEMLIALAVFSLAAIALINLQSFTVRNSGIIAQRTLAQSVVRNRAVELLTDPRPPPIGTTTGNERNGGIEWQWSQVATLSEDQSFVQVEITASDPARTASAAMTVLRPSTALKDDSAEQQPDDGAAR